MLKTVCVHAVVGRCCKGGAIGGQEAHKETAIKWRVEVGCGASKDTLE